VATSDVSFGSGIIGTNIRVLESLRENIREKVVTRMIYLTAAVAAFLFVYLIVALVRPEWF